MKTEAVLLVSKDALTTDLIIDGLKCKSWPVHSCQSGEKALNFLKETDVHVVLLDLEFNSPPAMALYQEMQRLSSTTPIIFLTSKCQLPQGPHIQKPVDIKELITLIECTTSAAFSGAPNIVAKSPQMKAILKDVKKLAKSNASVFISGESGTGKEMIAKAIHHYSKRKTAPFIRVNCAALPETLIESELFGHEKGSFTGAHVRRLGRFELADNGSLLLDEVTEIPLSLQSKLLRAIQEQEFERIGGMKSIKVDVRLIATSNRDMQVAISDKIFREDLYYRLNVLPIHLPPLRERKEDILPLTEQFLERAASSNHTSLKTLSDGAKDKILSYPWPGNIRELSNAIEHAVVMSSSDIITADDIALKVKCETPPAALLDEMKKHMTLLEMEKRMIQQTLRAHNGNRTRTAKVLGISIRTLRNKLKAYPELGQ